jgi:hypothetical protein
MARKDDILKSFLTHELLETKYQLKKEDLPTTIRDAINSNKPVIKAIALIIDGLEGIPPVTDSVLRNQVTQLLNNEAI